MRKVFFLPILWVADLDPYRAKSKRIHTDLEHFCVAVHGKLGVKTRQPKVGLRRQEAAVALAAAAVLKDEEPMDLEELEVGLQQYLFEIGNIRNFLLRQSCDFNIIAEVYYFLSVFGGSPPPPHLKSLSCPKNPSTILSG